MSHTKVPSLGDAHDASLAIGDDPDSVFAFDDNPWTPETSYDARYYQHSYFPISVRPPPTISSKQFVEPIYHTRVPGLVSQYSDYESNSIAGRSEDSRGSKDSGYESARSFRELGYGGPHSGSADISSYYPASVGRLQESSDIDLSSTYESLQEPGDTGSASSVRAVQGEETQKTDNTYEHCAYVASRQDYLDRHQKTHFPSHRPGRKYDCTGKGCGRRGQYGFSRKDHLREHLKQVHAKDTPKLTSRSGRGRGRLEDIASHNADSKTPVELKAQDEDNIEVPKPVGLPKSPLPTHRKSIGYVQVASDPKNTQGRSKSQSVKFGYEHSGLSTNKIERRPSTIFADAERSIMEERGVQDTVDPRKIMLEPDNEVRASILDPSVHTMPLTLIDTNDRLLNSQSDDASEHLQDGDDVSLVDENSWSNLTPIEHLANATMAEDGAEMGSSGEPIEPAEDFSRHQKPVDSSKAVMDSDEPSIANDLMNPEKRISGQVCPDNPTESIIMVEDAAQMNTLGELVEAVHDRSCHLTHDTYTSLNLVHMAPQYDAYVMNLLSLRIELRIWDGRHAPSPTIHVSTGGEDLLEHGMQRIRWTCRCGRRLYDDFEELRPGALGELEQMLNEQNRGCTPKDNGSSQHSSSPINALWNAAGGIIGSLTGSRPAKNTNLSTLPLHQPHAVDQERKSESSALSENLFILLCIPYRKHGTRLVNMGLADLDSDESLFRKLRHEYQSTRGQWASYFSLWKMAEIQFVKFGLHKHQLVDIKEKNDLPPVTLKNEYRYQPIPAETIPPIGKNHLMHLYDHPDHADDLPFCLERIPKKIREQLRLCQHQAPGLVGWGVYFAEGFNWPKFWIFGSVVLSLSVLFGVCWSTLRHDVQGGFGVTACMMIAVTFTTGVVQAAVGQT